MAEGRAVAHAGEAIVLRTWPFGEADLLLSLLTRTGGKVKGVARHALRSRRRFGGALEPATQVRAHYTERPGQDLVRMDSFEILWSPLSAPVYALRLAAMQLVVEVLDEALPENAPEDDVFRLAVAVLRGMEATPGEAEGRLWLAVTYFSVWMCRLMGWWPELGHCAVCGLALRECAETGGIVWWSPAGDGVTCEDDRRPGSRALSPAGVAESYRLGRVSLDTLQADVAAASTPAAVALYRDLGLFAIGRLERHLERRLRSAGALG